MTSTKTIMPIIKNEVRQPCTEISQFASGDMTKVPTPRPEIAIPVIIPLLLKKRLATVDINDGTQPLMPAPINAP